MRLHRFLRVTRNHQQRQSSASACLSLYDDEIATSPFKCQEGHEQHIVSGLSKFHPDVYNTLSAVLDTGMEDAFRVVHLEEVRSRMKLWKQLLPRVAPFYAVKCNPDQEILKLLASCGAGFDCASLYEIECALATGVPPSRIIYANPMKQPSHLRASAAKQVNLMTFDSVEELPKIAECHPGARVLLRLLPDDSSAQCQLGMKYGAPLLEVPRLLREAIRLGLAVDGVSFHVGSGNSDASAWEDALMMSHEAINMAKIEGCNPSVLNIGGGFPHDNESFESVASRIRGSLAKLFPEDADQLHVMAEPGRYMVATAETLAVNVIGMSTRNAGDAICVADNNSSYGDPRRKYFINDGIYGSFNCLMYDHAQLKPPIAVAAKGKRFTSDFKEPHQVVNSKFCDPQHLVHTRTSSVWGQTCDGLDQVLESVELPVDLESGDWLVFSSMGAYTSAAGSEFNGFSVPCAVYC